VGIVKVPGPVTDTGWSVAGCPWSEEGLSDTRKSSRAGTTGPVRTATTAMVVWPRAPVLGVDVTDRVIPPEVPTARPVATGTDEEVADDPVVVLVAVDGGTPVVVVVEPPAVVVVVVAEVVALEHPATAGRATSRAPAASRRFRRRCTGRT
jgi:hypothetical protein